MLDLIGEENNDFPLAEVFMTILNVVVAALTAATQKTPKCVLLCEFCIFKSSQISATTR